MFIFSTYFQYLCFKQRPFFLRSNYINKFYCLTSACSAFLCLSLSYPLITNADEGVLSKALSGVKTELSQTWQSQDVELYVPINTWHNRNFYESEDIDNFNERPWGIGAGKYRYDENGDWHGIYAMAFLDSHSEIEPIVGYGFQKVWRVSEYVRLGLGYTLGVTVRQDFDYVPIPLLLPLFSVKYKQVALQSTYVPGGYGHGNILFSWLRWELN